MLKSSLRLFPVCTWVIIKMSFASGLFGAQRDYFHIEIVYFLVTRLPDTLISQRNCSTVYVKLVTKTMMIPGHRLHKIEEIRLNHVYFEC